MEEYLSRNIKDTEKIAVSLAKKLKAGDVIAFSGGMGAGKTSFTRALVNALGAGDVASSPTFALLNEYEGIIPIKHFDMYRINSWDDLYSTGFFDYLESDALIIVEWSENIEKALPADCIRIDIKNLDAENERLITISGFKEELS